MDCREHASRVQRDRRPAPRQSRPPLPRRLPRPATGLATAARLLRPPAGRTRHASHPEPRRTSTSTAKRSERFAGVAAAHAPPRRSPEYPTAGRRHREAAATRAPNAQADPRDPGGANTAPPAPCASRATRPAPRSGATPRIARRTTRPAEPPDQRPAPHRTRPSSRSRSPVAALHQADASYRTPQPRRRSPSRCCHYWRRAVSLR